MPAGHSVITVENHSPIILLTISVSPYGGSGTYEVMQEVNTQINNKNYSCLSLIIKLTLS